MKFRNSIEIKEPSDWELIGCDVLDEFLSDFPERKGLTRHVELEDDIDFEGCVSYETKYSLVKNSLTTPQI